MSKVQIVGFLNSSVFFPHFVVAVFLRDGKCYGRYPTLKEYKFGEPKILDDLVNNNDFWLVSQGNEATILFDGQIAFAFSKERVVLGTPKEIVEEIQKQYLLTQKEHDILGEFISNLKNDSVLGKYIK